MSLAVSVVGACSGCASIIETSPITAFAKGLEKNDLARLKQVTSAEFSQRVLRGDNPLKDLENLHLPVNVPESKTKIIETEELSADRKRITVEVMVKERKKEIYYEIVKDDSGRWVVDDIFLKQRHHGVEVYKSVIEQMDLLLTVREFEEAWANGDREEVLAVTAPKFRAALSELPPAFLAQLTQQVTRGRPKSGNAAPKAAMDEKTAQVRLPRATGEAIVMMELRKGHWQVANIGISSKSEEEKLPSAMNLAVAVNQCIAFLSAYYNDDKDKLSKVCTDEFFGGSLSFADLTKVKLPDPQLTDHTLQVRLRGNRADFVLRNESEFVQIDMQRSPDTAPDAPPVFVVSDVTIYEVETKQEKRLSALFTAQEMLEVFIDALSQREIEKIRHCSTHDFSNRVWKNLSDSTIQAMPLQAFDSTEMEIIAASYLGALTKIEVVQGGHPFTYLLRDEGGRFMVDDIQWQMSGIPDSVKSTLEVLIPIQDFASGVALGRDPDQQKRALQLIQTNSSTEFNRNVWSQNEFVPNSGISADTFLKAPLRSMAIGENEIVVQFGDGRYGAKVKMLQEQNRYYVDDVQLIAGAKDSDRMSLKGTLKIQMAKGEARRPQSVQQVSHTGEVDRHVMTANHEVVSEENDDEDTPANPPRELDTLETDPFESEAMQDK